MIWPKLIINVLFKSIGLRKLCMLMIKKWHRSVARIQRCGMRSAIRGGAMGIYNSFIPKAGPSECQFMLIDLHFGILLRSFDIVEFAILDFLQLLISNGPAAESSPFWSCGSGVSAQHVQI